MNGRGCGRGRGLYYGIDRRSHCNDCNIKQLGRFCVGRSNVKFHVIINISIID